MWISIAVTVLQLVFLWDGGLIKTYIGNMVLTVKFDIVLRYRELKFLDGKEIKGEWALQRQKCRIERQFELCLLISFSVGTEL